jgi:hypothetical protein
LLAAPRTDPGVRRYRTGLLPRMIDEKPLFGPRMQDARIRQVAIGDRLHSLPCEPMFLSPPPDGVEPTIDQMVTERRDLVGERHDDDIGVGATQQRFRGAHRRSGVSGIVKANEYAIFGFETGRAPE